MPATTPPPTPTDTTSEPDTPPARDRDERFANPQPMEDWEYYE